MRKSVRSFGRNEECCVSWFSWFHLCLKACNDCIFIFWWVQRIVLCSTLSLHSALKSRAQQQELLNRKTSSSKRYQSRFVTKIWTYSSNPNPKIKSGWLHLPMFGSSAAYSTGRILMLLHSTSTFFFIKKNDCKNTYNVTRRNGLWNDTTLVCSVFGLHTRAFEPWFSVHLFPVEIEHWLQVQAT